MINIEKLLVYNLNMYHIFNFLLFHGQIHASPFRADDDIEALLAEAEELQKDLNRIQLDRHHQMRSVSRSFDYCVAMIAMVIVD